MKATSKLVILGIAILFLMVGFAWYQVDYSAQVTNNVFFSMPLKQQIGESILALMLSFVYLTKDELIQCAKFHVTGLLLVVLGAFLMIAAIFNVFLLVVSMYSLSLGAYLVTYGDKED